FVSEPSIDDKIQAMQERVAWNHAEIQARNIDQTRLAINDGQNEDTEFTFSVIGDSGSGRNRTNNAQRRVAEQLANQSGSNRFVLHTGDVVYLVGSKEQYLENFIKPYRFLLCNDRPPRRIPYDSMVFAQPFLPVPGNHDYYDLTLPYGVLAQLTKPLRQLLKFPGLDVGWHGSHKGDAYARAFLDYLKGCSSAVDLGEHLDRRYTALIGERRCLRYQPKEFTRLPNRYYSFTYGGIDFIGLDSSTFNEPISLASASDIETRKAYLKRRQQTLQERRSQLLKSLAQFSISPPGDDDEIEDIYTKHEQIEEQEQDIDKQLNQTTASSVDIEQLEWLKETLIESWNRGARGRILFFHHPPYVT
ncbi:MAG: metallophosphoesterase, partial [Cyanobacteria bacterium P01_E01_bin.48]